MVWVKLDDRFATSPKVVGLSDAAFRLHVEAMCYAGMHETGGVVPRGHTKGVPPHVLVELMDAGLWDEPDDGDHYEIHNWADFNPSKEQIAKKRLAEREKKRRQRESQGESLGESLGDNHGDPTRARVPTPTPTPTPPTEPEPSEGEQPTATLSSSPRKARRRQKKPPSPEANEVAAYLRDAILSHNPDAACRKNGAAEKWAEDIDRAIRLDDRTPDQLRYLIDFCHRRSEEKFWRANILSGKKLREQFDQLVIRVKDARDTARARPQNIAAARAFLESTDDED